MKKSTKLLIILWVLVLVALGVAIPLIIQSQKPIINIDVARDPYPDKVIVVTNKEPFSITNVKITVNGKYVSYQFPDMTPEVSYEFDLTRCSNMLNKNLSKYENVNSIKFESDQGIAEFK